MCIHCGVLIYGHSTQHYHKTMLKARLRRVSSISGGHRRRHGLLWTSKTHKNTNTRINVRFFHVGRRLSYTGYILYTAGAPRVRSSGVNISAKLTFSSRLNILYIHTNATTRWIIQIRIWGVLTLVLSVAWRRIHI